MYLWKKSIAWFKKDIYFNIYTSKEQVNILLQKYIFFLPKIIILAEEAKNIKLITILAEVALSIKGIMSKGTKYSSERVVQNFTSVRLSELSTRVNDHVTCQNYFWLPFWQGSRSVPG